MLSRTKCNPVQTSIFWSSKKAKFSLLVRPISVVTGRPHIKTNRVSGVNSKNLLHIQLDNYSRINTGNPGSVIVPQYASSKITVFVWSKNIILKFLGNTK